MLNPRDKMHLAARDMLWFLECHPALYSIHTGFLSLMHIDIAQVCVNKMTEPRKGMIGIWYTPERYKKFKKEFDKEFKEYSEEELKNYKRLVSIEVPYEGVYGYKWAPDHIEYWGDLSFVAYIGKDFSKEYESKYWTNLAAIETSGRSFEELIVNTGKEFKKIFGNFSKYDFLTAKEKANNKGKMPFVFNKAKPDDNFGTMTRNKKYIHVTSAELNRRWLLWFSKTDYCKKKWGSTIKDILSGKGVS